ncbi:HxlR family transcriptional regulator [Taibaiella chishuiensis]|uniref:HxlR family transcriptional regulator n=2 Tax=Taibaiella chishuiensis TaxID=1434707 RepID=A0A2P8CVA5_9BACT|nr:HxlR family transcriptional regulator [Taibaiella chishuiensis]
MPVVIACRQNMIAIQDTLDVISGKWRIPIIVCLTMRPELSFTELKEELVYISAKVLSAELRFMEENNLVSREVKKTTTLTVKYSLTAYGRTLERLLFSLMDWGLTHRVQITGKQALEVSNEDYINALRANLPPVVPGIV